MYPKPIQTKKCLTRLLKKAKSPSLQKSFNVPEANSNKKMFDPAPQKSKKPFFAEEL
jgi:hypothetical protein